MCTHYRACSFSPADFRLLRQKRHLAACSQLGQSASDVLGAHLRTIGLASSGLIKLLQRRGGYTFHMCSRCVLTILSWGMGCINLKAACPKQHACSEAATEIRQEGYAPS